MDHEDPREDTLPQSSPNPKGPLAEELAAAFGGQMELYIELIKAETARDAGRLGRALLPLVVAVPLLLIGYALLCLAATFLFGFWLGPAAGPSIVGVINLVAGGALAWIAVRRLQARAPGLLRRVAEAPDVS
jgi:uncharacterized membrane protein YdjX (TVP38/TMEM64 family)